MKSLSKFSRHPAGVPLLADDILEFHAARLLLLFKLCGISGRIDGLTKMAKLDFFVRYPQFFNVVCNKLGVSNSEPVSHVESSMIRFHYGPWDDRYYHVLSYLEAKQLIEITQKGNMYVLRLTDTGNSIAIHFANNPVFFSITEQMKQVKKVLGSKAGSTLKNLIYTLFDEEVAKRSFGEVID